MAFHPPSEATRKRTSERIQRQRAETSASVTARLIDKYRTEPDREFAEEFWGEMLRERGVDTASL